MGRYLILWDADMSRVPEDPKEQLEYFTKFIEMLKEDMKNGTTKDFGIFFGGVSGYTIEEGTEEEVAMNCMKYGPNMKCTIHPILSVNQLEEIMKKFANM